MGPVVASNPAPLLPGEAPDPGDLEVVALHHEAGPEESGVRAEEVVGAFVFVCV